MSVLRSEPGAGIALTRLAQPLAAAVPVVIFSTAALSLPLAAAAALRLSATQTAAWILVLYGLPALASLALTLAYRQPLLIAWHTGVVAFMASLAPQIAYRDLLGAMLVAGLLIAALGAAGLTTRVAALVPAPIVYGVIAGTVLPFVVGTFDALGSEKLLVGGALLAYLAGRRFLSQRVPPIVPALVVGVALAAATGRLHSLSGGWSPPPLQITAPSLSPAAILTVVPVVVPLVALSSNLSAVTYLRSQGYTPPSRAIEIATGGATALAAAFGPAPVCMASLLTPLTAGPDAGERTVRPWVVYFSATAFLLIAAGAAVAADLPAMLPLPLLLAVAGLALLGVLSQALTAIAAEPRHLGPLVAFVVASSSLTLLGLGAAFWALVLGTVVSWVLDGGAPRAGPAAETRLVRGDAAG
jgi:benzoate membrane transport protein